MPLGQRAGFQIAWRCAGHGPREALMLHCSLAHSGAFKGVMARLDDRLSMTAFDMPGHGGSADWMGKGRFQDAVVAIAQSFVDEASGPIDLIGHSFGGTALLRVAVEQPAKVRSLTLIEPPIYAAARLAGRPEASLQSEIDAPFARAQAAGDMGLAARLFHDAWGGGTAWDDLPAETRSYLANRMHLIEGAGEVLNADVGGVLEGGRLESLGVPVLLMRGTESPPVITAVTEVLAGRLPFARIVVVEGAGHMLPITHPVPTGDAISAFLGAN